MMMIDEKEKGDTTPSALLAPAEQKAVDDAFEDLFGYPWGTSFRLPTPTPPSSSTRMTTATTAAATKTTGQIRGRSNDEDERTTTDMLVRVLGPIRAARVLQTGGKQFVRRPPVARRRKKFSTTTTTTTTTTTATADATPMTGSVVGAAGTATSTANQNNTIKPTYSSQPQQYETKLFAGQKIRVAVASGTTTTNKKSGVSGGGGGGGGGGIDGMLQKLSGPTKITTVAKTSADWDTFKTETGLEHELERKAQGKDAYLVKQDFLSRVDNRKFELEREERDKERAKRGK